MLGATASAIAPAVRLPGLDPAARYRVVTLRPGGEPRAVQDAPPPWYADGGIDLPGAVLGEIGLTMPLLSPQQALVLEVTAL